MRRHILPTRLSTKLCFRSACFTRDGGQPEREVALLEVRLGFWRSSEGTTTGAGCVCCCAQGLRRLTTCSQELRVDWEFACWE